MKHFFRKKHIGAALLLALWLGYCGFNLFANGPAIAETLKEVVVVTSPKEIRGWTKDVEAEMADQLLGRMPFIEGYGYLQKLLGKREFNNFAYIKDKNDMLYYGSTYDEGIDDIPEYAQRLQRAMQAAEQRGLRPLAVLAPSKVMPGLESGLPLNDPNARMDALLLWLQYLQVPALDLRIAMQESGLSQEELFFRTDHHWTPLASFIAAQAIVQEIKVQYGEDLDPENYYLNPANYNSHTYSSVMLGSMGRNAGVMYSGLEDYTLLWPKFPTEFIWKAGDKYQKGDFIRSLLDTESLPSPDPYLLQMNTVYINEISDRDTIENLMSPEKPKLAAVRDSYFSPVACFLAPMFSEIDMVWNKTDSKSRSVVKFLQDVEGDYLIFEVYPHNIEAETFALLENEPS